MVFDGQAKLEHCARLRGLQLDATFSQMGGPSCKNEARIVRGLKACDTRKTWFLCLLAYHLLPPSPPSLYSLSSMVHYCSYSFAKTLSSLLRFILPLQVPGKKTDSRSNHLSISLLRSPGCWLCRKKSYKCTHQLHCKLIVSILNWFLKTTW